MTTVQPASEHRSFGKMELGLAEDCEEHAEEARHVPRETENKLGLIGNIDDRICILKRWLYDCDFSPGGK